MKSFEILLNNRYSATTQAITSGLDLQNDYYVYINRNGGGIVNQYNVRGYLNDPRNQQITADFFAFLTGSTSQDQALNILTADKKLSDTFNDYYQRVIISATSITSTAVIEQNLTGTNEIISYTFDHPWSGYAPTQQLTGITQGIQGVLNETQATPFVEDFTTEESYYLPIYLERGTNQLTRYKYDACDVFINKKTAGFYPMFSGITSSYFGNSSIANIISNLPASIPTSLTLSAFVIGSTLPITSADTADTRIHTILDCFVDLNLETNENLGAPAPLPKISFQFDRYDVSEGDMFQVRVGLDAPSTLGIEQATIDLFNPAFNSPVLGTDYLATETYPVTFTWAIGEQYKYLSFNILNDYFLENIESFNLQISNIINLNPGAILNTSVNITDTTVLRKVSLSVMAPAVPITLIPGAKAVVVPEGEYADMTLTLDGPAFGVEVITLSLVPFSIVTGGTIGPSTTPLVLNTDFKISATSMVFSFAPGETQKTFRFSALTDTVIENYEHAFFELQNPLFCLIDSDAKALAVAVQDTTGGYKYVHLNLGTLYSEFGSSTTNTLMRQINPASGFGGGYDNMYINYYNYNLIELGTTVNFADYSHSYNSSYTNDSISYSSATTKVKITNTGTIQSIVNNIVLNTGQTIVLSIPSNDFILTATTNNNKNISTNLFDNADYQIELINNYSGSTDFTGMNFKMRALNNTLSTTNSIDLGNYSLSGMTTSSSNTSGQYKLVSKYKNINTARVNVGTTFAPVYVCPPTSSSSYAISYAEFYANKIENASVFGIIFLNYSTYANYTNNSVTDYDSFDFLGVSDPYSFSCAQTISQYSALDYISLPFYLEP